MNGGVVVVGAGLAGLSCGLTLHRAGVPVRIHEASDAVGGRVKTDRLDGFLLDRGFQVLLTAYPECRRALDYAALDLKPFYPGALVWFDNRFHRVADPFRSPSGAIPSLFSPVGSLMDKLRIARLRASLLQYPVDDLFLRYEVTTRERLAESGFSAAIIDRLFRPLFGGIFLEPELRTSSRMFDFVFRMLGDGDISIPARGMAAIPEQLAESLPEGAIKCDSPVASLDALRAEKVVVATDGPSAAKLLPEIPRPQSRSVWNYYFAAEHPPVDENILLLNGDGTGPVNNCCIPTNVARSYGPPGAALISATVLEAAREHDAESVRAHLTEWFGTQTAQWRFLRRYHIAHAQPEQAPPALSHPQRAVRIRPGVYVCGDHRENASLNGALASGRRAAEALLEDLR